MENAILLKWSGKEKKRRWERQHTCWEVRDRRGTGGGIGEDEAEVTQTTKKRGERRFGVSKSTLRQDQNDDRTATIGY